VTLDYDIVIIGGSLAGRYAALAATQLKAKVALVEPKSNSFPLVNTPYGYINSQALNEIGYLRHKLNDAEAFGIHSVCVNAAEKCQIPVDLSQATLYARAVASNLQKQLSAHLLSTKGVDIIVGSGEFQSSTNLIFAVNNRLLKARSYLLATSVRVIPKIEGLQKTGFLTLSNIGQSLGSSTPPKNWVIIGSVPQSIELAQALVRLGCSVTLIVERPYILSHIDREMAHLLCSQLEADGVRILTQTKVTQVRRIEEKKWLQVGDKAIETDEIVLATGQQPNIEHLNLAAVGVKWHEHRLLVNDKLQTTNHRIYACGDVMGGYDCLNIAIYEANIALQNALFFPRNKVDYRRVPWTILTHPMLAQVGLTEVQAKHRYGDDEVIVLRQYFKTLAAAQLADETTGCCKLIVIPNGEVLGASILGAQARELINVIGLAIAQNIKVKHLANLSMVSPSFSEILEQTARQWSQQRLSSNTALQEFLESFFYCRRNWNL
jgi:pyruvate/2-oxoglutarate dehydrogenase complex dihydrolipoamide dehydrogenase (E3) component